MAPLFEMVKRAKSRNSCVELPDDDDRINNLPDGIRCHILSFLDTHDAVATAVLSTKWTNLWTTALVNIEFCDKWFPFKRRSYENCKSDRIKFSQAVNNVLLFHDLPVIKVFFLDCIQDSLYDVFSWVKMAIKKKVEDLCLSIKAVNDDAPFQLPIRLFTCDTLEVLKLDGAIFVRVLALYSLPNLKKMELSSIQYENEESVRKLISSCPSLESLDIVRDMNDGIENFIISSSTLKTPRIEQNCWLESDLCNHVINAPGLQHLELSEGSVNGFVIENLQSLVKADIQLSEVDGGIVSYDDNFFTLLQGLCNSKILNILSAMFQSAIPAHMLPKFVRLSSLEVTMDCCKWHLLQEFIKNSDRLETLLFTKDSFSCKKKKHLVCWRRNPKIIPICLLSSLKTMTYSGFDGLKDELMMVEYILKNAKVMQKMKIHFKYSLRNTKPEAELRRKLLKFSKGSEECQVIIA